VCVEVAASDVEDAAEVGLFYFDPRKVIILRNKVNLIRPRIIPIHIHLLITENLLLHLLQRHSLPPTIRINLTTLTRPITRITTSIPFSWFFRRFDVQLVLQLYFKAFTLPEVGVFEDISRAGFDEGVGFL